MSEIRGKLIELLSQYFDIGDSYAYNLTRDKSAFGIGTMSLDDFEEFDSDTISDIADYLIEHGVVIATENKDIEEKKMVYFPFPIDCEKCPKATDIGVCEELDLLYNGEHPKYTRAQDWEFMCDTCPYEVHGRKYREEDDKDFIGKTLFFTEEEAEKALKEGYGDDRIYKA